MPARILYSIYILLWAATLGLVCMRAPVYLVSIPVALAVIGLVTLGNYQGSRRDYSRWMYALDLGFILLLALIPRVIWFTNISTVLESDFYTYHTLASALARGQVIYANYIGLFPHVLGYPAVLSFFYRIFGPDVLVAQWLNAIFAATTAFLIYFLGTRLSNRYFGLLSAVILVLWPSHVFYSTIVSTEALFTLLFIGVILLFYFALNAQVGLKSIVIYLVLGMSTGILNAVRPMGLLILASIALFMLVQTIGSTNDRKIWGLRFTFLIVLYLGYSLSTSITQHAIQDLIKRPVGSNFLGYSMLVGSNYQSAGAWNPDDSEHLSQVYQQGSVHPDEVNRILFSWAIDRIASDPLRFLKLQYEKSRLIWQADDYAVEINRRLLDPQERGWFNIPSNVVQLMQLSTLYYIVVILIGISSAVWGIWKREINFVLFIVILILANWLLYVFVEVQGRYHYHLIPLLAILAGYGLNRTRLDA